MRLILMFTILSTFLLLLPIGFAQPELIVYEENNPPATGPFIAEAGSKLILWAKLEIDGEMIHSCNVAGADPCADVSWGFTDPYTFEVSENDCTLVPTSYGIFQCVVDVPSTAGQTDIRFQYKTSGEKAVGELSVSGGTKRELTVYDCGDGACNGPETQETCCTDCGVPPLNKCVNNKLEASCGDGLCQAGYTEDQNNCCNDCDSPLFYKCENNILARDMLQLSILILVIIACIFFGYYLIKRAKA